MNENLSGEILTATAGILSCDQMTKLQEVLRMKLTDRTEAPAGNEDVLTAFLQAKKVEGRSEKTLEYYEATIRALFGRFDMPFCQMTSAQLRDYLSEYQQKRGSSKVTIDNIRRIFSSFFSWLEDEEYIVKSPVRRIHKVKAPEVVKDTISDEEIKAQGGMREQMRPRHRRSFGFHRNARRRAREAQHRRLEPHRTRVLSDR